jgi:5-carboxymethyl-2-hydroxymuconate isomerase
MPQVTLEYTDNIELDVNFAEVFRRIHTVLVETGGIRIENCKSRAVELTNYYVGNGQAERAFVHLQVSFLVGRSPEQKQKIGGEILAILSESFSSSMVKHDMQITVEVREFPRELYFKIPEGTFTPP